MVGWMGNPFAPRATTSGVVSGTYDSGEVTCIHVKNDLV